MELYKKVRPQTLKDVVGQSEAVAVLSRMLKDKKVPQFLLFSGPSGTGKTTLARIVAKHLNCNMELDFKEMDGAVNRGIEDAKKIRQQMRLFPMGGDVRIFLVDECHMLTREAQTALLKATEDTPSSCHFIFCTTEPHKMLAALRGRASVVNLKGLPHKTLRDLVAATAAKESKRKVPDDVLDKVAENAGGSARKGLVLLEQVMCLGDEDAMIAFLDNAEAQVEGIEIARALMDGRTDWKRIAFLIKKTTEEPETIRGIILSYFGKVALGGGKYASKAVEILDAFQDNYYDTKQAGLILSCWKVVKG
jgi:DNA polymerase III gamma/tau subunit